MVQLILSIIHETKLTILNIKCLQMFNKNSSFHKSDDKNNLTMEIK